MTTRVPHTFAGGELDRAAHLRDDPTALASLRVAPGARFLPFRDRAPLLHGDASLTPAWQSPDRVRPVLDAGADLAFLGLEDGDGRFAIDVPPAHAEQFDGLEDSSYRGLRGAASMLSAADASTVALARSLLAWTAAHRFCPRCGSPSVSAHGGHQRRCTDPACATVQFPRTDPVVIMLIHLSGSCLMGRAVRSRRYPPGLYSCLAGYVEPGESIEEAVRREVFEEAGVTVGRVRYHSSQPWPFPSQLMIGCFAEALGDQVRLDPTELEEARWLTREELRGAVDSWDDPAALRLPPPLTIAHQLVSAWLAEEALDGR